MLLELLLGLRIKNILVRLCYLLLFLFFSSTILVTFVYKFVPVPYTYFMWVRNSQQHENGKNYEFKKEWVSIDKISPNLVQAVVASEDQKFLTHHGFDWDGIKSAATENISNHETVAGGSTISQQTAKNVFLWPGRSYIRKGLEVYFTALIELMWSKERIMEVYLNVIEMGHGVYGAQAAAKEHFHTDAINLTKAQSALIAGSLPSPDIFEPGHPGPKLRAKQTRILRMMRRIGPVKFN